MVERNLEEISTYIPIYLFILLIYLFAYPLNSRVLQKYLKKKAEKKIDGKGKARCSIIPYSSTYRCNIRCSKVSKSRIKTKLYLEAEHGQLWRARLMLHHAAVKSFLIWGIASTAIGHVPKNRSVVKLADITLRKNYVNRNPTRWKPSWWHFHWRTCHKALFVRPTIKGL